MKDLNKSTMKDLNKSTMKDLNKSTMKDLNKNKNAAGLNKSMAKVDKTKPKDPAVEFYEKVKAEVVPRIQELHKSLEWIMTNEVKSFISAQKVVRHKCGGSKKAPDASLVSNNGAQIKTRNDWAKAAEVALNGATKQTDREQISVTLGKQVSDSILKSCDLIDKKSNILDRAEFYPFIVHKFNDMESSPEDCLDFVIAVEHCLETIEKTPKHDWMKPSGEQRLRGLVGELGFFIQEKSKSAGYVSKALKDCAAALGRLNEQAAIWAGKSGTANQGKSFTFKNGMEGPLEQFFTQRKKWERMEIQHVHLKKFGKFNEQHQKEADLYASSLQTAAKALYDAQKAFCEEEHFSWLVQRNYCPEIFYDIQPKFKSHFNTLLMSADTSLPANSYSDICDTFVDRSLEEYSDIRHLTPALISCNYNGKPCILKHHPLLRRTSITALAKECCMFKKFPKDEDGNRLDAIFIDNGTIYLHLKDGEEDLMSYIHDEKFSSSVFLPILLIRHMCYIIHQLHEKHIIVGDVRPGAWYVTPTKTPKLHAYNFACIQEQVPNIRQSIIGHEEFGKYDAPEKKDLKDSSVLSYSSDIYGLGMSIKLISNLAAEVLDMCGATEEIYKLCIDMTKEKAEERLSSLDVLQRTDLLLDKLRSEYLELEKQKENVRNMGKALNKARLDLEFATNLAEDDLNELNHRQKDLEELQNQIQERQKAMSAQAGAMENRARVEAQFQPPSYWETKSEKSWEIRPIPKSGELFSLFKKIMKTDKLPLNMGGVDDDLDVVGVWRLENASLWRNYAVERKNLTERITKRGIKITKFDLRPQLQVCVEKLPGYDQVQTDINETYLLHNIAPDHILSIATSGVNERFTSSALFGKGSYFAEDPAKHDRTIKGDTALGAHPELHRRLFPSGGEYRFPEYPFKCYYLILCRVLMGYTVRVKCVSAKKKEMYNIESPEDPIFATSDQRELASIPGIENPPMFYHSLVAELGGDVYRFRDICQFHASRVYPEYLIGFTRN